MGAVLPVMVSAAGRTARNPQPELWFYAAYTAGGVIGLALLGSSLIGLAGAQGSMAFMVLINFSIASACLWRDRQFKPEDIGPPTANKHETSPLRIKPIAAVLAFLSGFGTIALEIICLELILLAAPLSFFPQMVILLAVLVLLAASTTAAALLIQKFKVKPEKVLLFALVISAFSLSLVPFIFKCLPVARVGYLGFGTSLPEFFLKFSSVSLIILAPAFLPAGFIFPALISWMLPPNSDRKADSRLGGLLAINGIGGLMGAEIAYFFLLPNFGVNVSVGLIGILYGAVAASFSWFTPATWRVKTIAAFSVVGVSLLTIFPMARLPLFLEPENLRILDVWPGSEGSLAIVENKSIGRALIFNSQYLLGGTASKGDMERQSHLPLLLHPHPKRVAFVGLGTGVTAGGSLLHQPVEAVTALELSPLVAKAAGTYFNEFNHGICQDPKAHIIVGDARTYLASCQNEFDVIIGDMFIPWRPGESRICTLDQFQSAYRALRPGGVFCQWFAMQQLTPEHFDLIASTFSQAFEHFYLFRNHLKAGNIPLALIGIKNGELDWNVVRTRCEEERNFGKLRDPSMRNVEGIGMLYLGKMQKSAAKNPAVNTLMNMKLELDSSLHFVAGNPADCYSGTGENWLNLLQMLSQQMNYDPTIPNHIRTLSSLGLLASRLEVAIQMGHASTHVLEQQLREQFPQALSSDTNADWNFWMGTYNPAAGERR